MMPGKGFYLVVYLITFFLNISVSYLQQPLHIPDFLPTGRAVLHVVVDPVLATVFRGRLGRLLVDDDLATKYSIIINNNA